jgi:diguanylate cyclase (GGDEF)-like protein
LSTSPRRIAALFILPVLLIGCAVFGAASIERNTALSADAQSAAAHGLLTAMLDQETGARGYLQTGEARFLAPWYAGSSAFAQALALSRRLVGSDPALSQSLADQQQRSSAWHAEAQGQIDRLGSTGRKPTISQSLAAKAMMDAFRTANATFDTMLDERRDSALSAATWFAAGLAALLSILMVAAGMALVRRSNRRERRRSERQRELRDLLQVSDSEDESRRLLIGHIERMAPGCGAAVLSRNDNDERLQLMVSERAAQTPLRDVEREQLGSRSCMAVRLSRSYARRPSDEPLLRCDVCGRIESDVLCEPLLVSGRVIGSVLIARERPIDERERAGLRDSVLQAAPILANQHNLAVAEMRAASDALTGLPNRRSADETLKRMAAHAGRTVTPLSAVLLDLDHFKAINDLHGHEQGDKALAAVAEILATTLRVSDFAARYGGEEFLILLPDTDGPGARDAAEKLRQAIERTEIDTVGSLTGSFGIATMPDDATDVEQLIRRTDRALYLAKAGGRNRVETAQPAHRE